jgi:hypothetical protein
MDAHLQETRENNSEIQMALPGLAEACEGNIARQNEIYNAVHLGEEKIDRSPSKNHSDIVIQSQVFTANAQAAFVLMKVQSTKAYQELRSALSNQMQRSGKAWGNHPTLLDNRKRAQEHLALQVQTQSQERADGWIKAKEDSNNMSGLYTKSRQEVKKIHEIAQKKEENTQQERKAAEHRMKKDFERKLKKFTRALQTKLSDKRIKTSVRSMAR